MKRRKYLSQLVRNYCDQENHQEKKLEGISKKLNLTPQMLKDIEAGKIENFPQSVHITGFLRAFAEKVNCDISLELEQLVAQDNSKNKINQNLKFTIKNSNILIIIILIFIFFISFIFIASTPKVTNNEYESRVLEKKILNRKRIMILIIEIII